MVASCGEKFTGCVNATKNNVTARVAYENLNLHALGIVYKAENTFRAQGLMARHRIISISSFFFLMDTSIRRLPDTSAFMAIDAKTAVS